MAKHFSDASAKTALVLFAIGLGVIATFQTVALSSTRAEERSLKAKLAERQTDRLKRERSRCAATAQTFFKSPGDSDSKTSAERQGGQSNIRDHYSIEYGRCLMELSIRLPTQGGFVNKTAIFDANEHLNFASYASAPASNSDARNLAPAVCKLTVPGEPIQNCSTRYEWTIIEHELMTS